MVQLAPRAVRQRAVFSQIVPGPEGVGQALNAIHSQLSDVTYTVVFVGMGHQSGALVVGNGQVPQAPMFLVTAVGYKVSIQPGGGD